MELKIKRIASGDSKKMFALANFLSKSISEISSSRRLDIGSNTYIVGGAVRNFVIGKDIKDIDIVIDSISLGGYNSEDLAKDLQQKFTCETNITTNKYGVVIFNIIGPFEVDGFDLSGEQIEIANARSESYTGEGYKPDKVEPVSIKEDVYRREFTFNSLMWRMADIANGFDKAEIIDITGCGLKDLESGEMRCPRDPDQVFDDDPSRMLRAVKFVVKYGFKIPKEIRESIIRNAHKLSKIPPNQIGNIILTQILSEPTYRSALILMSDLGLLDRVREILVSPKDNEEEALKNYFLSNAKKREVKFLLSLLEVGLPLGGPLSFLSDEEIKKLEEITSTMSAEEGWRFIGLLSNPGPAIADDKFFLSLVSKYVKSKKEMPDFVKYIYKPTTIKILLETPEIINNSNLLKERIVEEIERKLVK